MVTVLIVVGVIIFIVFALFLWALIAGADDTRKERLYREQKRKEWLAQHPEMNEAGDATANTAATAITSSSEKGQNSTAESK